MNNIREVYTSGHAILSPDGRYRYFLSRHLDDHMLDEGVTKTMTFVMLNPSTADADTDDQTIRRCVGYARRDGCNHLQVVNLYAYRTVSPKVLREAAEAGVDVVGPDNLGHVDVALRTGKVVVAWGSNVRTCPPTPVAQLLANWSQPLWCIGATADGSPRHPSRGEYKALVRWSPLAATA